MPVQFPPTQSAPQFQAKRATTRPSNANATQPKFGVITGWICEIPCGCCGLVLLFAFRKRIKQAFVNLGNFITRPFRKNRADAAAE